MKRIAASFFLLAGLMTAAFLAGAPTLASAQPLAACSYPCTPPTGGLVSAEPLAVTPPAAAPVAQSTSVPLTSASSQLAFTGIDAIAVFAFALLLVGTGLVTVRFSRRRHGSA